MRQQDPETRQKYDDFIAKIESDARRTLYIKNKIKEGRNLDEEDEKLLRKLWED
ncbi:hypothetical protein GF395_04375 [Candidatus Uhrbacteria bacterium]|nr:hypothetical protein [Candidatus Uhrbacteria bacterium]